MPGYAWIVIAGMVGYFTLIIIELFVKGSSKKEEVESDEDDEKPSTEERFKEIEERLDKLEKEEEPVKLDVMA